MTLNTQDHPATGMPPARAISANRVHRRYRRRSRIGPRYGAAASSTTPRWTTSIRPATASARAAPRVASMWSRQLLLLIRGSAAVLASRRGTSEGQQVLPWSLPERTWRMVDCKTWCNGSPCALLVRCATAVLLAGGVLVHCCVECAGGWSGAQSSSSFLVRRSTVLVVEGGYGRRCRLGGGTEEEEEEE